MHSYVDSLTCPAIAGIYYLCGLTRSMQDSNGGCNVYFPFDVKITNCHKDSASGEQIHVTFSG